MKASPLLIRAIVGRFLRTVPLVDLCLGRLEITAASVHRTGRFGRINWPGFPDEGYRFFFDDARQSHLTIRPSGTSNALRFHVQLYGGHPSRDELIARKADLRATTVRVVDDIRDRIGAPR